VTEDAQASLEGHFGELIEAVRFSRPPLGVKTRIVAVDGPGGAGKSSLARWLAPRLDARIVSTDDLRELG